MITAKQSTETWFNRLNKDPAFRAAVAARWKVVARVSDALPQYIDERAAFIGASAEANFARYHVGERLQDDQILRGSWVAEVAGLKEWTTARSRWLTTRWR